MCLLAMISTSVLALIHIVHLVPWLFAVWGRFLFYGRVGTFGLAPLSLGRVGEEAPHPPAPLIDFERGSGGGG